MSPVDEGAGSRHGDDALGEGLAGRLHGRTPLLTGDPDGRDGVVPVRELGPSLGLRSRLHRAIF